MPHSPGSDTQPNRNAVILANTVKSIHPAVACITQIKKVTSLTFSKLQLSLLALSAGGVV